MTTEAAGDEKRVDLVFEGGGVKGIGLAGAFSYLDEQGFKPQRVAGTSAGGSGAGTRLQRSRWGCDEATPQWQYPFNLECRGQLHAGFRRFAWGVYGPPGSRSHGP